MLPSDNRFHTKSPCLLMTLTLALTFVDQTTSSGDIVITQDGYLEYCDAEQFEAKCAVDHVIYMKNALYGRMRTGRCVDTDYGYVGCGKDVLHLADWMCSGRPHCQIPVPNTSFKKATDCPKDLKPYFEAGYECLPVETAPKQNCQKFLLPSRESGYLSNHVMLETRKGSADCPWMIQGHSGQRINFTVYDFSRKDLRDNIKIQPGTERICRVYAVIRERGRSRGSTVCSGNGRLAHAYLSTSHAVEVRILGKKDTENQEFFLLKYDVIGCPDPDLPDHAWMERDGEVAIIGCPSTNQKWRLICDGNTWSGSYGNCSQGSRTATFGEIVWGNLYMSFEVSLTIVIGIAVGIGVIILACGVVCIRSACRPKKKPKKPKPRPVNPVMPQRSVTQPKRSGDSLKRSGDSLKKPLPSSPRTKACTLPRSPALGSRSPAVSASHSPALTLPRSPAVRITQETHGPLPPPPLFDNDDLCVTENEYAYISELPPPPSSLGPHKPPHKPPNPGHGCDDPGDPDGLVLANPMNYQAAKEIDSDPDCHDYTDPPTPYTSPEHVGYDPDYTDPPTPYTSPKHVAYSSGSRCSSEGNLISDTGYFYKNKYSFLDTRNASDFSMKLYDAAPPEELAPYYEAHPESADMVPYGPPNGQIQNNTNYPPPNGQIQNNTNYNCGILESRYWRNKNPALFDNTEDDQTTLYSRTGTL